MTQGNKGATAIRLVFTPPPSHNSSGIKSPSISTTLTFVNSHLAAFDEMVERRNADFWDLGRRLKFECGSEPKRQPDGSVSMVKIMSGLYESDLLIWMVRSTSFQYVRVFYNLTVIFFGREVSTCHMTEGSLNLIHRTDLNYRLDLPDLDVRSILASESWGTKNLETLLRYDQVGIYSRVLN